MASFLEIVTEFLESDEWPFSVSDDETRISTAFAGENGRWDCFFELREEFDQLTFYSLLPVDTPSDRRSEIAEFITRANFGMVVGNFEMDYSDGETRFRTSVDVEGTELNPALVKTLIYTNVITMDRYLPGLLSVIHDGMSAEDAVEMIEGEGEGGEEE